MIISQLEHFYFTTKLLSFTSKKVIDRNITNIFPPDSISMRNIQEEKKVQVLFRFVQYFKFISKIYMNLESHKRQLANLMQKYEFSVPFQLLDLNKTSLIRPQTLQVFLMKHNYFRNPQQIKRYFLRYSQNQDSLDYDDVRAALLPCSSYLLVGKVIRQKPLFYQCTKAHKSMIEKHMSFIINEEIMGMERDFMMVTEIMNQSLHLGAQLWRYLDRNHCNELTFENFKSLAFSYGIQFEKYQWKAVINWHFASHTETLNRQKILKIMEVNEERKRVYLACKYDQYLLKDLETKKCRQKREKQKRIEELVKEKMEYARTLKYKTCQKQLVKREIMCQSKQFEKSLLSGPKGYSVPRNHIKSVQIVN